MSRASCYIQPAHCAGIVPKRHEREASESVSLVVWYSGCLRCSDLEDIDTQTSCSQTEARRTGQTNGIWTLRVHSGRASASCTNKMLTLSSWWDFQLVNLKILWLNIKMLADEGPAIRINQKGRLETRESREMWSCTARNLRGSF